MGQTDSWCECSMEDTPAYPRAQLTSRGWDEQWKSTALKEAGGAGVWWSPHYVKFCSTHTSTLHPACRNMAGSLLCVISDTSHKEGNISRCDINQLAGTRPSLLTGHQQLVFSNSQLQRSQKVNFVECLSEFPHSNLPPDNLSENILPGIRFGHGLNYTWCKSSIYMGWIWLHDTQYWLAFFYVPSTS